jgi:hypothetical protein
MDCIQAQSVVSETLDGSPVDAAVLEAAKTHCRECEQCTKYVRALSAVRRATPPAPPADLTDRIMAAIRAEVAAQEAAAELEAAQLAGAVQPPSPDAPGEFTPNVKSDARVAVSGSRWGRVSLGGGRMDRRQLIAWGSAAAVLLVVVGVSAALGIMQLVNGANTRTASTDAVTAAAPESAAKVGVEGGALQDPAASSAPVVESTGPENLYVIFDGAVYAQQSGGAPQGVDLKVVGQTTMSFDANTPPASREVLRGDNATAIYIRDDSQQPRPFVSVQRSYQDAVYTLQSADLTEYGQWPSLPPGVPRPVPADNPNGSPVFSLDGQDASGTPVYRRVGSDRQAGIAIAPGTSAEDPAAGNPNWTWWVPPKP